MDRIYEKSLILWFPWTCCVGPNTDLPSNTNISKTVRVNIVSTITFFQEYSVSFLMICKLIGGCFSGYWCLTFVNLLESRKLIFSIFPVLERLNRILLLGSFLDPKQTAWSFTLFQKLRTISNILYTHDRI